MKLSEIVSHYTKLTKAGRQFFGLCPFHLEEVGSFVVNDEKGIYHCFGCGKGGNQENFLKAMREKGEAVCH